MEEPDCETVEWAKQLRDEATAPLQAEIADLAGRIVQQGIDLGGQIMSQRQRIAELEANNLRLKFENTNLCNAIEELHAGRTAAEASAKP